MVRNHQNTKEDFDLLAFEDFHSISARFSSVSLLSKR